MMRNKRVIAIPLFLIMIMPLALHAQSGASKFNSGSRRGGPGAMPMMIDLSHLDEYRKQMVFASRNIEGGDYESAMNDLRNAEKIRDDDPMLYEMMGIVYDADRQSEKALTFFNKAGEMYFDAGNLGKTSNMIGWMRTIDMHAKEVQELESKLKDRQGVINRERFQ